MDTQQVYLLYYEKNLKQTNKDECIYIQAIKIN